MPHIPARVLATPAILRQHRPRVNVCHRRAHPAHRRSAGTRKRCFRRTPSDTRGNLTSDSCLNA
eukprot:6214105-Pleurochrysis_carterae.AAC.2